MTKPNGDFLNKEIQRTVIYPVFFPVSLIFEHLFVP